MVWEWISKVGWPTLSWWNDLPEQERSTAEILAKAKTGDIILFQGEGAMASLIRWLTASTRWSHVGIVIEVTLNNQPTKMITEIYAEVIGTDVVRGGKHTGVQFIDLKERISKYDSHKVAWRPLLVKSKSNDLPERAAEIVKRYRDLPEGAIPKYDTDLIRLIQYGSRNAPHSTCKRNGIQYYVCTAWAAQVLMWLGVIHEGPNTGFDYDIPGPEKYGLVDFGLTYYVLPTLKDDFAYQNIFYQVNRERVFRKPRTVTQVVKEAIPDRPEWAKACNVINWLLVVGCILVGVATSYIVTALA